MAPPSSSVPAALRVNLRRQPLPRHWGNGSPQRQCLYIQADSGLVANNLVYRDPNGFGIQVRARHGHASRPANIIVANNTVVDIGCSARDLRREQLLGRPHPEQHRRLLGR